MLLTGVYRRSHDIKHFVDVNSVTELHKVTNRRNKLTFGANISINEWMDVLYKIAVDKPEYSYCGQIAKHLDLIATVAIRNVKFFFEHFPFLQNFAKCISKCVIFKC